MNRLIIGVTASAISALLGSAGYLAAQMPTNTYASITPGGVPVSTSGTSVTINISSVSDGAHVWGVDASGRVLITNSSGVLVGTQAPALPQGSAYHQVVDIYYDGDGNKLDAKSTTHRIDYDCNRNLRRQDENLMVQDDGKGNVRFVQSRLPSEPLTGVKPVTPDGIVKAQLAMKRSPPLYIDPPPVASTPQLASKE